MRVSSIRLQKFRRFADTEIREIPKTARLVVLTGPNGSGKSSLFDAFLLRYRVDSQYGWNSDKKYYNRPQEPEHNPTSSVTLTFHDNEHIERGSVYVRTAYRHDPEFVMNSMQRQGPILDALTLQRLIDTDATVGRNYQRLAAQAMEDVFVNEDAATTFGAYRDKLIGECREPFRRLFPDLTFTGVGNPLDQGTFQFDKGSSRGFDYKNLSGGEKAAFDLILDLVVKRRSYTNAVYCIDEPEIHTNTKVQGALLGELLALLPDQSQLWIGTHSIGMMRYARELYDSDPTSVAFLDFRDKNFDQTVVIRPSKPTRAFWEGVMNVALGDIAALVAPRIVVVCEGNPAGSNRGRNAEHDARVYETIFAEELPDVKFVSAGSAKEVAGDFIGLAAALPKIASGMKVIRLIDHDDRSVAEVQELIGRDVTVLGRRHIESYLYDDEVLDALCGSVSQTDKSPALRAAKVQAVNESVQRGNPADDIKSAAGNIYTAAKRILNLTQVGSTQMEFARNTLAPLIRPGMAVYADLKVAIFGAAS